MSNVIKKLDLKRETVRDLRVKASIRTGLYWNDPLAVASIANPTELVIVGGIKPGTRSVGQSDSGVGHFGGR
jgi:hypothetical protein